MNNGDQLNLEGGNLRESYPDVISLKPLVRVLWSYRRVIAASVSAILIVFLVVVIGLYLFMPFERQASVQFQVLFDGADKGLYPNGLVFSSADIVSTPVLTAVYDQNELKRYFTYGEFKNRIFILQTNTELEQLQF